jgi:hypothetical protein
VNPLPPLWSANQPYDEVLPWLKHQLEDKGLRVMPTFDLRLVASLHQGYCTCPHHGTAQCDCQLVVLLVYRNEEEPVSLMLHGSDGQTWLSIVNRPGQSANPVTVTTIQQAVKGAI